MDSRPDPRDPQEPPGPLWPASDAGTGAHGPPAHGSGPGPGGAALPPETAGSGAPSGTPRQGGTFASFLRELPVLVLVAFLLAFLLRTFVVQVFYIPSSSMEPTLQVDDRMVVEKITFRFREPRRGDVVVFEGEDGPRPAENGGERLLRGVGQFLGVVPTSAQDFVKRVIAVEGDQVRIEQGRVFVNDVPLDEPYVVHGDNDDFAQVTVPEDHLFFLGDNRPNSSDSRRDLGFVERDAVVGRAVLILWPLSHWDLLTGVHHDLGGTPESGASGVLPPAPVQALP